MARNHESFRSRLLASENWKSPAGERYQQTVNDLVSGKLTPTQKTMLFLLTLFLASTSVLFVWLAITQEQLPLLARLFFLESTAIALALVAYLIIVLRRGVFHRRHMPKFVANTMWIFAVLLSLHFIALIPLVKNPSIAIHFLGIAMITLIGSSLQLILVRIEHAELNTHERLLEMFYRLADGNSCSNSPDAP